LKEAYMGAQTISLVLDLVRGGELFERIIKNEFFNEKDASEVTRQLLEALKYMHERGCAHRDIKAENVLLVDKTGYAVKIADFGLSNALGEASRFQSCVGTTDYMAPEMLEGAKYGFGVDVWGVGVLAYIMLCGYPPFYGKTENERVEKILSGHFEFADEVWDTVSESAKNFICHLLVMQPQARYTAAQALKHPWITKASLAELDNRALPSLANLPKMKTLPKSAAAAAAPAAAVKAAAPAATTTTSASTTTTTATTPSTDAATDEKKKKEKEEQSRRRDLEECHFGLVG